MIRRSYLLAGSLAAGLALPTAVRFAVVPALAVAVAAALWPRAALALALALTGWWWGSTRLQSLDADEKALVGLLVDQPVGFDGCSDAMEKDARRPVLRIQPNVKKSAAIGGPKDGAGGIRNEIGEILAGGEIAKMNFIEFRSRVVGRPRQQPVVV